MRQDCVREVDHNVACDGNEGSGMMYEEAQKEPACVGNECAGPHGGRAPF